MYAIRSYYEILKQRRRPKKRRFFQKLVLWLFVLGFFVAILGAVAAVGVYFYISKDLPVITSYSIHYTKLYDYIIGCHRC